MKPWSKEEEAQLRTMYAAGAKFTEIAKALGYSVRKVQSKSERLGLSCRRVPSRHADPEFLRLRAEGKTAAEIGKIMGATPKRVRNWISTAISLGLSEKRHIAVVTVWTDDKVEELRRLWAQGFSPSIIARIMKKTPSSIDKKASVLGLPRDRAYPKVRKKAPPREYKFDHLRAVAAKPKPKVTDALWLKTETSRLWLERESGQCAFPLGEQGDIHSCCDPVLAGDTYCEHHRLIAGGLRIPGAFASKRTPDIRRGPASVFDRGRMAA